MFDILFYFLISIILPTILIKYRTNIDFKEFMLEVKLRSFNFLISILNFLIKLKKSITNYSHEIIVTKDENIMKIKYYCDGEIYSVVTPIILGPRPIRKITKINGEEILLREYLGPYGNFHDIPTTPKMLGIDENIIVYYRKHRENIEYRPDEIIKIII
jgi:hypothetical protein